MLKKISLVLLALCIIGCGSGDSEKKFMGAKAKQDYIGIAMQELSKGNVAQAITNFDNAIKSDPTNPQNYIILGQVYLRLGDVYRAIDSFSAATKVDPQNGEAFYLLSTSNALADRKDKALEMAKQSAEIFMQEKDEENFRRSLALIKSLSEEDESADMPEKKSDSAM